ncbi:PP2C family protein-serine/threonine phosphatase [Chondromyces apiculatus]|uniref:Protein serine/threonine phosphatase PrpC, regulation of stationary phase n=1 Tax=Chondromyces apiculatus DSM 436 TaxID=1192034 RepID=A0A017SZD2_9BACT|nr:PP2C family serine/threonine-protein phosphatase [Chondromyces apiculatus]EYF02354.1 Protein serine/threonine phosphatase PrpC, regulation of stationary phase [Chondromyces apiculatus DSM 436]
MLEPVRDATDPQLFLEAAGCTHVGMIRDSNQDSFALIESMGLFLLADGMGGRAAGEIASRMAVDTVRGFFDDPDATWPIALGPPSSRKGNTRYVDQALPLLVAGIQLANGRIFAAARRDRDKRGMGTTFAGALARDGFVAIAHVGDSRVYRYREGQMELLTRDHSLLNECIRLGHIQPEDAASFPLQHVITRALGTEEMVEVETRIEEVRCDDVLLLCSDGLSGPVSSDEMAEILDAHVDVNIAVRRMVQRANERGGPDNVTCILARWSDAAMGGNRGRQATTPTTPAPAP